MDFFDALDLDSKLRDSIAPYIAELEAQPLHHLIKHDRNRLHWFKCPICWRTFRQFGKLLRHFRTRRNLWEFHKLINNIDNIPKSFLYYQHDYIHGSHPGRLYNRVKLWVICKKILHELNPRGFLMEDYRTDHYSIFYDKNDEVELK
jgi:hypothetical protein